MVSENIIKTFKKVRGIITNSHIVLTSGRHTSMYINKDAIYPHTQEISWICRIIANKFKNKDIDVVASPALGGIILSQWVAYHLSKLKKKKVFGIYTEKTIDKQHIFTRGYDKLVKGKKVLVVEDITTTGGSAKKVVDSVRDKGGEVIGVVVLVNRDPLNVNKKTFGAPFYALAEFIIESYEEKDCPLCKKNIPINTEVGKGREYLVKKH